MRSTISRRAFWILPLAAALPHRARAAILPITDALGRTVTLPGPAERIVVGFNFEEFTAVAGPGGWDRVVGFDRHQWENNRRASWTRYQAAIPRLSGLADIGDTEKDTFSVERVLGLKPDLLITLGAGYASRAPLMAQIEQAGVPIPCRRLQCADAGEARRQHARARPGNRQRGSRSRACRSLPEAAWRY